MFPHQNLVSTSPIPISATCTVHLILLDLITQILYFNPLKLPFKIHSFGFLPYTQSADIWEMYSDFWLGNQHDMVVVSNPPQLLKQTPSPMSNCLLWRSKNQCTTRHRRLYWAINTCPAFTSRWTSLPNTTKASGFCRVRRMSSYNKSLSTWV